MWSLDGRTTWILIAWLTPIWWATFLLVVAWLGDVVPSCRGFESRLFDDLESARWRGTVSRREIVLAFVVATFLAKRSASAGSVSDLRAGLQRYPATSHFAASALVRVSGQSADAGARSGSAKLEVECDSGGMGLRTPPATLAAAAGEAQRK